MSKKDKDGLTPYQRWYKKRKDQYNQKRRERYSNDSAYATKQVKASREYRRNTQMPDEWVALEVNDKTRRMYPESVVAKWLDIPTSHLRDLHTEGLLGAPWMYETKRFYTRKQILIANALVKKISRGAMDKKTREAWVRVMTERWNEGRG